MYKNYVFDVDGTIVDTENASLLVLIDILKDEKIPISNEKLALVKGKPGETALKELKIKNYLKINKLWHERTCNMNEKIKVFEGILETIQLLRKKGYLVSIVTSNKKLELERTFRMLNIRFKFDYIVCADDTKNHKPSSEPMLELIRKCNCKKDEIIYIGDTINDSICAEKSGVDFGLALWGADSNIKAKYYFNNPYDLLSCSLRRYSLV